jgi:flagellar biosynthetic protein FliR
MDFALPHAWGFALVVFRTTGLFAVAPIFSAFTVPMRLRMGIAFAVAVAIFTGAGMPRVAPADSLFGLAFAAAAETAIGLCAGLCARLVLEAALGAGHVAGLAAGLGYGSLVDPFNGASSSVISQLLSTLALAFAVAADLHAEAIAWLCRSVMEHPPGSALAFKSLAQTTIVTAAWASALSVRLAFPFMAAGLMGNAALGVLNRSVPQLSLQNIGFSISLIAGGAALFFAAPAAAEIAARSAVAVFR